MPETTKEASPVPEAIKEADPFPEAIKEASPAWRMLQDPLLLLWRLQGPFLWSLRRPLSVPEAAEEASLVPVATSVPEVTTQATPDPEAAVVPGPVIGLLLQVESCHTTGLRFMRVVAVTGAYRTGLAIYGHL